MKRAGPVLSYKEDKDRHRNIFKNTLKKLGIPKDIRERLKLCPYWIMMPEGYSLRIGAEAAGPHDLLT